MKKTYNTKTNHGNVSLLAHIAPRYGTWIQISSVPVSLQPKWTKHSPPFLLAILKPKYSGHLCNYLLC